MLRKIVKIGNSKGITLDKKMLKSLDMGHLDYVWVEPDKNKKQIIIRKRTDKDW